MDDVSKRVKWVRILVPFFRFGDLFSVFIFRKTVEIDHRNELHILFLID
jgi:hypothetical protein